MHTNRETGAAQDTDLHAVVRDVLDYLRHTEEGHLDAAREYLAPGAQHTFPGGREFSDLAEWFSYFRSRMSWIRKRGHVIDLASSDTGDPVVYVRGYLDGETAEGKKFEGVRFIDRFELRGGQISVQDVWNDLAAHHLEPDSTPTP